MSRNALLILLLALVGCDWFEDPTPETVTLRVDGETGTMVELVMSTQFVSGVTETGITQIQLFVSDTIVRTLPVDTIVSIAIDRRFFAEIAPFDLDAAEYRVRVDVNERRLLDDSGEVLAADPFRYVYLFNSPTTRNIEVF